MDCRWLYVMMSTFMTLVATTKSMENSTTSLLNSTSSYTESDDTGSEGSGSGSSVTVESVFYMILGCVGVLDNAFVIFIMLSYKPLRQKLTSIYLINQSLLDCMGSLLFVAGLDDRLHDRNFDGVAGDIYCKLWKAGTFQWTCYIASTYNLVAITLDRYAEVCHAVWHRVTITKRKAVMICASTWLISLSYCFAYNMPTSGIIDGTCWAISIWPSSLHSSIAGIINFTCNFFIPVCIMVYSYTRISLALRSRVAPSRTEQTEASATEKERSAKMARVRLNVIKTMGLVCLVFLFCWVWNQVWFLLYSAGYQVNWNSRFYVFTVFCVYLNASINPLIYIIKYEQFQRGVRAVILGQKSAGQSSTTDGLSTVRSTVD